jgi:DeoR/GlpR family transcriptional regulator of sugar metabolism
LEVNKLFKNERLTKILEILQQKRTVSTGDLQESLFVSASTLRRDLLELENMGKIARKFGRVELVKPENVELSYLFREQEHEAEKRKIADTASVFLGDNHAIFVDSSSTASFMANYLTPLRNIIVITNGLRLAVTLDSATNVKTFVTGGRLRTGSGSIVGDAAMDFINSFRADLAIISCVGVTGEGVYMSSETQGSMKRQMMAHADQTILLCDHSKFGVKSYYRLGGIDQLNAIVTDQAPSKTLSRAWQQAGADVLF